MEENQENQENEKNILTDEKQISWRDMLGGKIMLNQKITKHYKFILLIFLLCFIYVGIRLSNEDQVRKINKIEETLKYQKEDFYRIKGRLNKDYSRDELMYKLNNNQMNMVSPDTPPFKY